MPFASFDRDSWRVTWPLRVSPATAVPVTREAIPEDWWGTRTPISGGRICQMAPRRFPSSACRRSSGRSASRGSGSALVSLGAQLPPASIDPFPKDGVAISGGVPLEPIETVKSTAPEWPAMASELLPEFDRVEDSTIRDVRSRAQWKHPHPDKVRHTLPIRLESWFRAPGDEPGSVVSYIEASRQYPPGPADEGCGLETVVSGWLYHRDGKLAKVKNLRGKLTYCDRYGVTYMLPFGRVRPNKTTYWVFQLSGWESEWYEVVATRRRLHPLRARSRGWRHWSMPHASMISSRMRAASGLVILILTTLAVPLLIPLATGLRLRAGVAADLPAGAGGAARARRRSTPIASPIFASCSPATSSSATRWPAAASTSGGSASWPGVRSRRCCSQAPAPRSGIWRSRTGSIASGIRPRVVFIFFRDTNLTDVMFRLDEQFRWALDLVALDREDELNAVDRAAAGPAAPGSERRRRRDGRRAGAQAGRAGADDWPVTVLFASRRRQAEFLPQMNERLGLDHLRRWKRPTPQSADEGELRLRSRCRRVRAAADAARREPRRLDAVLRARAAPAVGAPSAAAITSPAPLRRRPAAATSPRAAPFSTTTPAIRR